MPPRTVFGPRRPIAAAPFGQPPASQRPGARVFAQPVEALQSLLLGGAFVVGAHSQPAPPPPQPPAPAAVVPQAAPPELPFAGRFTARTGPAQPATPQQIPGRAAVARAEPPPPDLLAGRCAAAVTITTGPWSLVQPVVRPTVASLAAVEEPQPVPGRLTRSGGRPPFGPTPPVRPTVARSEEPPTVPGRFAVGPVGSRVPRRPVRPLVVAPEVQAPAPGSAVAGKPPPPNQIVQQSAGVVRVAVTEEPPPFPGWCFTRQRPLVPSHRLPFRPRVASAEEPPPFPGAAVTLRVRLGNPPPGRFVLTLARTEEPPPFVGAVVKAGPAVTAIVPAQIPGRVVVAWVEAPRPDWIAPGRALVLTGANAGAAPPSLPLAGPLARLVRADARDRRIWRAPRMSALSYVTRTKTPDEVLAVVFDFSNFPEIVAGATISSAVVSGPGRVPLTGLVAGVPSVLTSAAVVDSLGNTVAAGKGVQVALAGGGAGDDVIVSCAATLSTGSVATVQGKIAVRNAV